MLKDIMLSFVMLNVILPSVGMLNVATLSFVTMTVVALCNLPGRCASGWRLSAPRTRFHREIPPDINVVKLPFLSNDGGV
jgi:hypothetical protein